MITGYDTSLPADCLLDSGVLYIGSTPIGVSRGGLQFDPGREVRNIEFDGKRAPIKGLDRVTRWMSKFIGTIIEFASTEIDKVEPGNTNATAGGTTTYTPKNAGTIFASGDYLSNVRLVFERSGGGYAAVLFASGFIAKWGPMRGTDNNEAEIPIEVEARQVVAANSDVPKCPYVIEIRSALP